MNIINRILFLLTAAVLFSCSGSHGTLTLEPVTIKELKNKINKNSALIETLEASGNIAFDSPENSGSGWIELKIKKPDTVFVKIEGPFGISIANALITRSDFIYYNVQENKVFKGPSSDINIGAILRIKVSFDDLINGFTGSFLLEEYESDSLFADVERNCYLLTYAKNNDVSKFFIEPEIFRLKRYNLVNNNNESLIEVDYSNYYEEFVAASKVNFPYNIKIRNPQKSQSVYIEFQNKEINKNDLQFQMKIPKSAKEIRWE